MMFDPRKLCPFSLAGQPPRPVQPTGRLFGDHLPPREDRVAAQHVPHLPARRMTAARGHPPQAMLSLIVSLINTITSK